MDRFVSTFTNKIDAKGRVSVPASFRAVLERDRYSGAAGTGLYCYPSLDAPALDAGGERLAQKIDGLLGGLPDYSDERDELAVALYGEAQFLAIDQDGRIVLPKIYARSSNSRTVSPRSLLSGWATNSSSGLPNALPNAGRVPARK